MKSWSDFFVMLLKSITSSKIQNGKLIQNGL